MDTKPIAKASAYWTTVGCVLFERRLAVKMGDWEATTEYMLKFHALYAFLVLIWVNGSR